MQKSFAGIIGLTCLLMLQNTTCLTQKKQTPPKSSTPPPVPAAPAGANYDEAKVPAYALPDPLTLRNGKKVTDRRTSAMKRRAELLKLFATNVYGSTPVARPKSMMWEVVSEDRNAMNGRAITKTVTIYFTGKKDDAPCTRMNLSHALSSPTWACICWTWRVFSLARPFN